ncbi:hypothetical protein D3C87_1340260 [compost metagenome]
MDRPVGGEDHLAAGGGLGDQRTGLATEQLIAAVQRRELRRGVVDAEDLRVVVVQRRSPSHRAEAVQVLSVVTHHIDARSARAGAIAEELRPGGGRHANAVEQSGDSRALETLAQNQAITQVDHVAVHGQAQVFTRGQGEAEAEVGRALGFQRFGTQRLGADGVHRQNHVVVGLVDAVDGVETGRPCGEDFVGQRGRAKAVADGAAHRKHRVEFVAGAEFAAACTAHAFVVMLVACSDAQIPLLDGVEAQVDVSGDVVAADFLLVVRGDAVGDLRTRIGALSGAGMADGEHVAAVNVRGFGAGARLVAVTSMLETEGDIQRLGQADVVAVLQVEVAGPLIGDVDA